MSKIEQTKELRRTGIGGTDAGAILGINPYKSAIDVWLEKLGQNTFNFVDSDAAWFGREAEELVAKFFTRRTGMAVRKVNRTIRHPQHDFLLAHPDRVIVGKKHGLEIKTRDWRTDDRWGEPGSDEIPEQYLAQVHWYNLLMNWEVCHVACLNGRELTLYEVPRSAGWDEALLSATLEFWNDYVVPRVMPPVVEWNAIAQRALKRAYPLVDPATVIVADEQISKQVDLQRRVKDRQKENDDILKGLDAEIRAYAQNFEYILLPDGKCIRKIKVDGATVPAYFREPYTYLREVKTPKGLHVPAIAITEEPTDE